MGMNPATTSSELVMHELKVHGREPVVRASTISSFYQCTSKARIAFLQNLIGSRSSHQELRPHASIQTIIGSHGSSWSGTVLLEL